MDFLYKLLIALEVSFLKNDRKYFVLYTCRNINIVRFVRSHTFLVLDMYSTMMMLNNIDILWVKSVRNQSLFEEEKV